MKRKLLYSGTVVMIIISILIIYALLNTRNRILIRFDIGQNQEIIYLSTYAEPPQFAIWIEDPGTGVKTNVFVTHRAGIGDWEGKSDVPVALPRWAEIFRNKDKNAEQSQVADPGTNAVTGATPKEDYFSVNVEVKPGTVWICWIEMNLAGDFNESFPEYDEALQTYDEFSCGQPALLYRADIEAIEDSFVEPKLVYQSMWDQGLVSLEPVSKGVTTAREVFNHILVSVNRPKPKLIEKRNSDS